MKTKLILYVILILTALLSGRYILHLKKEKARLSTNYEVMQEREKILKEGMTYEKTRNNELMTKVGALELSNTEMRQSQSEMLDNIKDMKVKLRRMESYSATSTETVYNIETTVKDSIIRDTIPVQEIKYKSQWIDFEAYIIGHRVQVDIVSRDSLIQVVHWERPKKILFIKFGRKKYFQNIKSANPFSKITYSEVIIPRKK